MKTVGKQLLEARTAKGWSPEMAARETKIRLDRLKELEDDDYSNFSSPTYARGFVRTYARALGIDEYRILRQLDNKLPEDDNATFVNDTGIPYMPEPSQVAKPFELTRGVYIAGGIGVAVLFFIGFILVEAYRADLFTTTPPAPVALPVTATNALPAVPDTQTARAVPVDSNAAPVALPVDQAALAAQPAPATAATATNAAPRALPVDLSSGTSTNAPTVQLATAPATPPVTAAPAASANSAGTAALPPTVPTTTTSPPRAMPVDLNALTTSDTTNAPVAEAPPASNPVVAPVVPAAAPVASPVTNDVPAVTPAPVAETAHAPVVHALSARESNSRPSAHAAADKATQDLIASSASAPTPQPAAAQVVLPANTPAADSTGAQSSADPSVQAAPSGPVVLPQASAPVATAPAPAAEKSHGKRLVLTASHDSFVRVVSLDGGNNGQTLFSRTLKTGESVSFSDHKYSINVGNPSAVDIALDGINYGPHSEDSSPDTFTVESHTP